MPICLAILILIHDQVCEQHCASELPDSVRRVVGFDHSTVCLETVMAQCYSTISEQAMDHMFLHAPEVIAKVRSDGRVTDVFLDSLNIVKLPEGSHINRDDLVTWRQHAHVMSHNDSKAKFVDYLQMRADKNNPVLQLKLEQAEKAAKVLAREAAARDNAEKAARDKAVKESQRVAESERRRGLSAADKRAEAATRKVESAHRKAVLLR